MKWQKWLGIILLAGAVLLGAWLWPKGTGLGGAEGWGTAAPEAKPNAAGRRPVSLIRRKSVAELDVRAGKEGRDWSRERLAAVAAVGREAPGAAVDFDGLTGSPSRIQATGRFLTPAAPGIEAGTVVKDYVGSHRDLFGYGAEALTAARLIREDVTARNGMTTLVWQQQVDEVPVFEGIFKAAVTKNGELANVGSQFLSAPRAAAGMTDAERGELLAHLPVTQADAISLAAANLGDEVAAADVKPSAPAQGAERRQPFVAPGLSDVQAGLAWLPMTADSMRLTWDVTLMSLRQREMFRVLVDAKSGETLVLRGLTNDISPATYNVYADPATFKPAHNPAPMVPGLASPGNAQGTAITRHAVTLDAIHAVASPNGWINDGGTETLGNNVDAHTDLDSNNISDLPRPNGGAARVFDFPLNLAQSPSAYRDAAVTQLFYYCNFMHDKLYELGFTESAGNFQTNNFGRGGSGNDAVLADAQDGGLLLDFNHLNNANFSTPADGSPGRMQMYLFDGPSPMRDGDLDGEIVLHEYAHGLSNRLVGGGVGMAALQSRGMGEGWSDFYALALLSDPADDPNGCHVMGAYATKNLSGLQENYYFGIRRYPYSTDLAKNPLTLKDIDPTQADGHGSIPRSPIIPNTASDVHNLGEVWCMALWEARANLIAKYGGAAGNQTILELATDGMKLAPANPTFLQARDAILLADLVNSGGADSRELWLAFAKRGMGSGASVPASTTTAGVVESFDSMNALVVTPMAVYAVSGTESLGPFTPAAQGYSLQNTGPAPLNWTVAVTQPWLAAQPGGGVLAGGASTTVTVTVNDSARTLAAGTYPGAAVFSSDLSTTTLPRPVSLTVHPLILAAALNNASSTVVTSPGFSASGRTINLNLNFTPSPGAVIKLVDNTASGTPIEGQFVNLPNHSLVTLAYQGAGYVFYVDYAGGDGNDLTLSLTPIPQSIAFETPSPQSPGAAPFTLNATASSGLPVAFSVVAGPASLAGKTVTLSGAPGAVTIRASQTGDSTFLPAPDVYQSFVVGSNFEFAKVVTGPGAFATYGLKANGTLWSWGLAVSGSLGDASASGRWSPQQVGVINNWTDIAAGGHFGLGLRSDGSMLAWGVNSFGQLGDGTTVAKTSPTQIGAGAVWVAISAGASHCAAIRSDGTLWTWGNNNNNQLGDGTAVQSNVPKQVGTDTRWKSVSCGGNHTLALKTNGELWAWGFNAAGQLGINTTAAASVPVRVGADTDWDAVCAGGSHSLGRKINGTLWAWGGNDSGQIGDGTQSTRLAPVPVGSGADWSAISAGANHSAGRRSDGSLWVWGANSDGEMGDGSFTNSPAPRRFGFGQRWAAVSCGATHTVAMRQDGSVWAAGESAGYTGLSPRRLSLAAASGQGWVQLAGTGAHFMAVRSNGTLWGWGGNGAGQVGDGTTSGVRALTRIGTDADWKQVAAGCFSNGNQNATLAVKTTGTLWGWGHNGVGQLGDGTLTDRPAPVQIGSAANWSQVSLGSAHAMAVKADGTLWGWGSNGSSQLGDGTATARTAPVQIGTAATWKQVACGGAHTLGLRTDGTLWAWGGNAFGQLGDGSTSTRSTPVQIGSATDWVQIGAGLNHSVALKSNGTLWSWGFGGAGALGNGSIINRSSPFQVNAATDWAEFVAGANNIAAITAGGTLWTCGANDNGQTGAGAAAVLNALTQIGTDAAWREAAVGAGSMAALRADGTFWTAGLPYGKRVMDGGRDVRRIGVVLPVLEAQSFDALPANVYTWQSPLSVTTTSGLPVSLQVLSGPASVTGGGAALALNGPGAVVAAGWQGGDDSAWNAIPPTQISFVVATDLSVNFSAPNGPGVTHAGFDASQVTLSLTTSFAPTLGLQLTLVNNTGSGPVVGTFPGVAQNGTVNVVFNGVIYPFHVNYAGGDGNDIILSLTELPQSISLPEINPKATTDAPFALAGVATSGLPVTYSILAGPATLVGNVVTLTGAEGAVTVKASQAGTATYSAAADVLRTFAVGSRVKFIQMSTSGTDSHSLAIGADGSLWAWGTGTSGQVGDNASVSRFAPVRVGAATNWTKVSSGGNASAAIRADGTLWTWGLNSSGQLGLGDTFGRTIPSQTGGVTTWSAISVGGSHMLALRSNGTLWAWGLNSSGQLGNGSSVNQSSPVQIGAETTWVAVAAGSSHSFALKSDGTLWAWGLNSAGQLGVGDSNVHNVPTKVGTATTWKSVAASQHALAVRTDGTLWGWGINANGQIGDGSVVNRTAPVRIGTATDWRSVGCGGLHSVAIKTDGSIWAWGDNSGAQSGSLSSTQTTPLRVGSSNEWAAAQGTASGNLALKSDGTLWAWGDSAGFAGTSPRTLARTAAAGVWTDISGSYLNTYALRSDGSLWSWGSYLSGALGIGTAGMNQDPVRVAGGSDWTLVRSGVSFGGGLRGAGTLWMWGINSSSQIGDGTSTTRLIPVQIGSDADWRDLAMGSNHTMAVKANGSLWGWGNNSAGQLGDGTLISKNTPTRIGTDTDWKRVFAGSLITFAIKANGTLWAWGTNANGALGDGTFVNKNIPTQVGAETDWAAVSVDSSIVVGLRADGSIWSWGTSSLGGLGQDAVTFSTTPARVGADSDWVKISAAAQHMCAIKADGSLWAWGDNSAGQLADGTLVGRGLPVRVGTATGWQNVAGGLLRITVLRADGSIWAAGSSRALGLTSSAGRPPLAVAPVFPGLSPQTIGMVSAGLNAYRFTSSSGLPVSIAVTAGAAVVAGDMVTLNGVVGSSASVYAWQQGDDRAWNAAGPVEMTFSLTLPPAIVSTTHSAVADVSANLSTRVIPNGSATSVSFRYGTHPALVGAASTAGLDIGAGLSAVDLGPVPVTGLSRLTTYYYQTVAVNSLGTTFGPIQSFATTAPEIVVEQPAGTPLVNGASTVSFGNVAIGTSTSLVFTVRNSVIGTTLNLGPARSNNEDFPVNATAMKTALAGGSSTTFTALFTPGVPGEYQALLTLANDDPDESPFTVTLTGRAMLPQTIEFGGISPQTCGTPLLLNATTSSGLPVIYSATTGASRVSIAGNVATFLSAGSVTLRASQPGDATYYAAPPVSQSFTVAKGTQIVTFSAHTPTLVSYGDPLTLSATSNRGLPVGFAVLTGPAKVAGSTLTFTGPGTVVVEAQQSGNGAFVPAVARATIKTFNTPPVAQDGTASGPEDSVVTGVLISTDAQHNPSVFSIVTGPGHGSVTLSTGGNFSYVPAANYFGGDSFTFRAYDGFEYSNIATETLTVTSVNDIPVAPDVTVTGAAGTLLRGALAATDVDGDSLTFERITLPQHGKLNLKPDGSFTFLPDPDFMGADSFNFVAFDGQQNSRMAKATLVITSALPGWTWMQGSNVPNKKGVYGKRGEAGAGSAARPGARQGAAAWTDALGNYWLMGGQGYGETAGPGLLNDLWKRDAASGQWIWLKGGNGVNGDAYSVYGAKGVAATANQPGPRSGAACWVDRAGKLWLFGGAGLDTAATSGLLNDLWKYDPVTYQWTWVAGAKFANGNGVFTPNVTTGEATAPSSRTGAVTWVDGGALWLFGGRGLGAAGTAVGALSDLWKYDLSTHTWSWLHGPSAIDVAGDYGTLGKAGVTMNPGGRSDAAGWLDGDGNFWLFGGYGLGAGNGAGHLNDLWKYDPSLNLWTWMRGASVTNAAGNRGTLGTPDPGNQPGARSGAVAWTDAAGGFWLFGGATGGNGLFNDVWRYQPSLGLWTWMKGPSGLNGPGSYGVMGSANAGNTPGARRGGAAYDDGKGNLWLLGGGNGAALAYDDLWRLDLPPIPVVRTLEAQPVTPSSLAGVSPVNFILRGQINANGLPGEARFRYSTRRDLAGAILTDPQPISATATAAPIEVTLTGLAANTVYYFQALASNPFGSGVGEVRTLMTPGTASTPVANFALTSVTVPESAGVVAVVVTLDSPSTTAFTIPFTFSLLSTAAFPGDYTASRSPLMFSPGQISAAIPISIHDDTLVEAAETLILSLGTPTGGVQLGPNRVFTLTIADDDRFPKITAQPTAQFSAVGSDTTFRVAATGSPPLAFQWLKNGKAIPGATAPDYTIAGTSLSAAAKYSVRVSNPVTTIGSAEVELSVIDTGEHVLVQGANSSAKFTVAAVSPSPLQYQWRKSGVPLTDDARTKGAQTNTLKLASLNTTDEGGYACEVTPGGGAPGMVGGVTRLTIVSAQPALLRIGTLPSGLIGGAYAYRIPVDPDPARTPDAYTVTGLPAGLSVNALGWISGRPTAAVTNKPITITAKNAAGKSAAQVCLLTILPLPPAVPGTYIATVERDAAGNPASGGRLDLTVAASGHFSIKLTQNGATVSSHGQLLVTAASAGGSSASGGAGGVEALIQGAFARPDKSLVDFSLTISAPNQIAGSLEDRRTREPVAVKGYRSTWNAAAAKAVGYKGYYTFALNIFPFDSGDRMLPQGSGFGSFTVADNGMLTLAGRAADGVAFTASSFIGPAGQLAAYASLYSGGGSLLGTPVITLAPTNNRLAGVISWSKSVTPARVADRTYREGFGPVDLAVDGGKYAAPAAGQVIMGLPNHDFNARLTFAEGGLASGQAPPVVFSITNSNAKGIGQTVKLPKAGGPENPGKVTFALAANPAGQFSGSLTVSHPLPALVRVAPFRGAIVCLEDGQFVAAGYFITPQLPEPGQTLATSPQLSGKVMLENADE